MSHIRMTDLTYIEQGYWENQTLESFIDDQLEGQKFEVKVIDLKMKFDIQISILRKSARGYNLFVGPSDYLNSAAKLGIFHLLMLNN